MQMTDYRAGQQFYAGMGVSTILPDMDFETYSEAGFLWSFAENKWKKPEGAPPLKKGLEIVGGGNYACDPTAEVLSFKYDLKDGRGPQWWKPGMPNPTDLFAWLAAGGLIEAHYSTFEHWVWEHICVPLYGWPRLPLEQLRCSMAKSRAHALPGKLAEVGAVLNIVNQKDPVGTRLINKFTMPRNPTKKDPRLRIRPEEDFEGPLFYQYNERDIVAESEVSIRVPDLSPMELRYWLQDQRINYRGIQIDEEAVDNCIAIVNTAIEQYGLELEALAGCKPSELQQLKGWLHAHGVHLDSMDEEAIEEALTREGLPPQCRRALEIRAAVGSASVKKVYSMRLQALKGRLHDLYTFFGARTGRPTGNGPQPTNLPKAGPNVYRCGYLSNREPSPTGGCGRWHGGHTFFCPWCKKPRGPDKASEWNPGAVEDALLIISGRSLWLLQEYFGDAMLTIAGVLRGLFIAKPGCDLISSDFTAIEGVVIAELAGETWRTEVYAGHGLMYLESASRAFGVPLQELIDYAEANKQHHPLRDKGKRMELGLGFGGWIKALRSDQIRYEGTDDELKAVILKWRAASPNLVEFWGGQSRNFELCEPFGLEGAALRAIQYPGTEFLVYRLNGTWSGISYVMQGDALYCKVPSGGLITYHEPRLTDSGNWRGMQISYSGWNTNPKQGAPGWVRMSLYSGKCAENVTQRVARDIQMHALASLEDHGYPIVMHTYDEFVAEVPLGFGSIEEAERIACDVPPWAKGWPIKQAGGWRGHRYRKA